MVRSFILINLLFHFYRVQLLANAPRTDFSANTLVLSYRLEENYSHAMTEISFAETKLKVSLTPRAHYGGEI